jgi:triosephosphate isomerase
MSNRRPFIGGNWKMNTDSASAIDLAEQVASGLGDRADHGDVVLCPPYPYLEMVGRVLGSRSVGLGAQDVSPEASGAFTGQVSAGMLLDVGAKWTLVGHSERRHGLAESDELVARKLARALQSGLKVVLCCGETLEERTSGNTHDVNQRQLEIALEGLEPGALHSMVIAYEPVWAIGTGSTPSLEDAEAAHQAIRTVLARLYDDEFAASVRIIYGGSMNATNVAEFISSPEIDGGLIGGASLKADQFLEICNEILA